MGHGDGAAEGFGVGLAVNAIVGISVGVDVLSPSSLEDISGGWGASVSTSFCVGHGVGESVMRWA